MLHDAGEVGDDLAALGIVAAHAAEPEAVLLRAVEDGEGLLLDKFVALGGGEAEGVAVFFEGEEELGAVVSSHAPVLVAPRRRPTMMGTCWMPTGHWNSQAPQVVHSKAASMREVLGGRVVG